MEGVQTKTRKERKKKHKDLSDDEESKELNEKKLLKELISDVALTQNDIMLTQLNT